MSNSQQCQDSVIWRGKRLSFENNGGWKSAVIRRYQRDWTSPGAVHVLTGAVSDHLDLTSGRPLGCGWSLIPDQKWFTDANGMRQSTHPSLDEHPELWNGRQAIYAPPTAWMASYESRSWLDGGPFYVHPIPPLSCECRTRKSVSRTPSGAVSRGTRILSATLSSSDPTGSPSTTSAWRWTMR